MLNVLYRNGLLICSLLCSLNATSNDHLEKIHHLVHNGCVMLNDENGERLIAIKPDNRFVPASIIKVLTSYIALDILGPEFRFPTKCYTNSRSDLIIKGYGDPFMVSDEIRFLARALKKKGCTSVNRVFLDRSYFSDNLTIPGISFTSNPYDALNGALVVNFNTINVGKNSSGTIYSAEKETPLTPLAITKASTFSPGTKQRVNLSADREACAQYAGELFVAIFREQGITVADSTVAVATVSADREPVLTYYNSRSLPEVLKGLLKYSNNFIANQLFLSIGARVNGAPATMAKSRSVFGKYIHEKLSIPESQLVMVEGSGISRDNKITGAAMLSIMERFKPNAAFLSSRHGHPVKSGTLRGVSNYAGYLSTVSGLRPFVIMLNQKKANRDSILKLLERL